MIAPRGATTPFGTAPRIKAYPVVAVFEIGMSEFDLTFVFMPFGEAQAYFNRDEDASVIEIFISNPDQTQAVRDRIQNAAPRPLLLTDWRQRNRTFFNALEVERNVMFLILTLIVLVAALNIVSGLIMLVKDKSSDIAILRTMGAARDPSDIPHHRRGDWRRRHLRGLPAGAAGGQQCPVHLHRCQLADRGECLGSDSAFPE